MEPLSTNLVEIYTTYDLLEAEQIRGFLEETGILAKIRDLGITPYPLNIGGFNEKRIIVLSSYKKEALKLIANAIEDQVISSNGIFIDKEVS
ncbi:MAG: DUF2007 domain-containing protein [Nitrospirae bacterium]|nr:DUF2007 domain-containing protein [Nitrospirota bacterium]MBI3353154.1 DUF2007 domain-containing protein [Nitrospirota bacterium]